MLLPEPKTPGQAESQVSHLILGSAEASLLAAGIAVILAWIVYTTVFKKGK